MSFIQSSCCLLTIPRVNIKLPGNVRYRVNHFCRRFITKDFGERWIRRDEAAVRRRLKQTFDSVLENRSIVLFSRPYLRLLSCPSIAAAAMLAKIVSAFVCSNSSCLERCKELMLIVPIGLLPTCIGTEMADRIVGFGHRL